jgi:hypothetical protein
LAAPSEGCTSAAPSAKSAVQVSPREKHLAVIAPNLGSPAAQAAHSGDISRDRTLTDEKYGVTRSGHDWVKAHIMTAVKTIVVTAVRASGMCMQAWRGSASHRAWRTLKVALYGGVDIALDR